MSEEIVLRHVNSEMNNVHEILSVLVVSFEMVYLLWLSRNNSY